MRNLKVSLVVSMVVGMLGGGAIGASAQGDDAATPAATWVTGQVSYAPSCASPTLENVGDVRQERGYSCAPQTWTSDDPRLGGRTALRWNADVYTTENGSHSVVSATWDIRGENGGWQCANPVGLAEGSGLFATDVQGTDRLVCTGDGENAGLSAVLTANWVGTPKTFEGLIIAGEPAPPPES